MHKINISGLIGLFILSMLTACSLLSPVKTEQSKEYLITATSYPLVKKSNQQVTIQVLLPDAHGINDNTQMAYSIAPYQVSYFSKNQWADSPAQMLQPLIVQALQNTHYFKSVGTSNTVGRFDYILNTELLQFHQVFFARCSVFRMTIRAQIVNEENRRVVATHQFFAEVPAPMYSPYGGVIAANRATARLLTELANWCVNQQLTHTTPLSESPIPVIKITK